MKTKTKFFATGLIAGLAILSSTVTYATQNCQEMPGNLNIISVTGQKPGGSEHEITQENRVRLNEKAMEICSEAGFCVEEASIKTTFYFHEWRNIGGGTMTAVVNCLQ